MIWIKLEIDRFFVLKLLERSFLLVAPHDVQCQMRYLLQTTTTCMVTTRPQPSWPTWQLQVDTGSACVREWVRARVCWRNQNGNCVCVVYLRGHVWMCVCACHKETVSYDECSGVGHRENHPTVTPRKPTLIRGNLAPNAPLRIISLFDPALSQHYCSATVVNAIEIPVSFSVFWPESHLSSF